MTETTTLNNRYVLEAEIGRGGMGTVYRARDLQLDRIVAIKVLPHEFTRDTQFLARFKTEVLNTAKLQHPYIVSVYDVGIDDNTYYYVMQLIEGQDLKSLLSQPDRIPEVDILKYLEQVAHALDFAHANGIIHRDIKPENILIDKYGIARVTDFGIARSLEGTRMTSGLIGTPEYMSPEQAQGNDVDGLSDQYSLAIVAYEMFTGTTPFRTSTSQPWAVVNKHINEPPLHPRQFSDDISDVISVSLLRALAKKPEERFVSCIDFIRSLSSSILVKPVIQVKPKHHSPVLAFVMTILLIGMVAGGGVLIYNANNSSKPEYTEVNPPSPPSEVKLIPPNCKLSNNSLEQSVITVTPSATDDKAVNDITIYWGTGDSQPGCVSNQSYTYTYPAKKTAEKYLVYAKATDSDNLTATSLSISVNIPATVPEEDTIKIDSDPSYIPVSPMEKTLINQGFSVTQINESDESPRRIMTMGGRSVVLPIIKRFVRFEKYVNSLKDTDSITDDLGGGSTRSTMIQNNRKIVELVIFYAKNDSTGECIPLNLK